MKKSILDPIIIPHLKLKNRIIRSATWEALAERDGSPSREQIKIYEELAAGGVGGIITGFTSVADNDTCFNGMARLSNDTLIKQWSKVAEAAHQYACPIITQLALGEFVQNGIPFEPDACSQEQIRDIISLFGDSAQRAKKAGFDGVQIHAAHNFYLSRFISPMYNHRHDQYGTNIKGRAKILLDIIQDIRQKAPGIHVTIKINCSDFFPGGLTPSEALKICAMLAQAGIDSIEVSGNGTSVAGIKAGQNEGYFLPFAKELHKACRVPIILVGGHRSIECMERIINEEGIELLSLSRPLIREPNLVQRWQNGDTTPAKCISCNACYQTPGHRCIFVKN